MKQNTLGTILSFYRKKYEFLQQQICDGICSLATLSRIEKGINEMDSLVSESLLGRIGKEVTRFEIILNDEDYELWQMREDIKKFIQDGENEKAEALLEVYKKQTVENHPVHKQFYLFYYAGGHLLPFHIIIVILNQQIVFYGSIKDFVDRT